MLAMVVQVCGGRANVGRCGSRRRCEDATSGITRVARRCTLVRRRRRRRRRRGDAEINRAGGPGGRASGQRYPSSRADAVDTTRPGRDRSTAGCKLRLVQRDGLPTLIGRLSTPISGAVPDRRHAVTSAGRAFTDDHRTQRDATRTSRINADISLRFVSIICCVCMRACIIV